jgi:hypothetical protein
MLLSPELSHACAARPQLWCENSNILRLLSSNIYIEQYCYFPSLYFLQVILLCIHRDRCPNIMEIFVISFLHLKSIVRQQNVVNEACKIIRKTYILNNKKTVVWGFHHGVADEQVFWVVVPCDWVISSWPFKWMYSLYLQGYELSITTQKTCFLNMKTGLQLIKSSSACHFQWVRSNLAATLAVSFTVVLFLSLTCFTGDKKLSCYCQCFTYM